MRTSELHSVVDKIVIFYAPKMWKHPLQHMKLSLQKFIGIEIIIISSRPCDVIWGVFKHFTAREPI